MRQAADVGGGDDLGLGGLQMAEFAVAQLGGDVGLQDRVGACGAAAQVGFRGRHNSEPGDAEQGFDHAGDLLAVLQRAGCEEGDTGAGFGAGGK